MKKILIVTFLALLLEFLVAWIGFVYAPIIGVIFVITGWVTSIYGAILIIRNR